MEIFAVIPYAIILFAAAAAGVIVASLIGFVIFNADSPENED
jgi:hypothetical protein